MYELYYRVSGAGESASKISISDDYEADGTVEAASRGEALRKWYLGDISGTERVRTPVKGDVIKSPDGDFFILTLSGVWGLILPSS